MRGVSTLGAAARSVCLLTVLSLAAQSWAGEAARTGDAGIAGAGATASALASTSANPVSASVLRAEYRVRDARGERTLVLVRSDDRIEYRMQGEPAEVWRKTPDGIARLELFADDKRSVAWSPGDLRTTGRMPQWPQLASPIHPELRTRLQRGGDSKVLGAAAARYRGESAEGQPIALDWIEAEGLPAYYRSGPRKAKPDDAGAYELRLIGLERVPAGMAFTDTAGYRETDYADLGDMELDPFAASYLKHRGDGHSHGGR